MKPTIQPRLGLLAAVSLAVLQMLPTGAAPRQPWPPLPELGKIHSERFDQPYHLPTNAIDPSVWTESWSGWALIREQNPVAAWVVPMVGANTNLQINPERGALRIWYRPAWSSSSTGLGSGPGGGLARLLTMVASNGTQSVTYWSVAINATGDELDLLCEGASGPTVCASGPISFVAGDWQLITCGYTETNSALFLNAQQTAAGSGLPTVSAEAAPYAAVVIGSGLAGDEVAMGEIDEFAAFSGWNQFLARTGHEFGLSELWSIGNYWTNESARAVLGPVTPAELAARQPATQTTVSKGGSKIARGGGGFQPLVLLTGAGCITNGPILITNFVAWATNVGGTPATYVNFNVIGSNSPYSLYRSLDVSAPFLSTNWLWVRYVNACDDVTLTNEPAVGAFYRVASGPAKDSDSDGMPDDWEVMHGLDPTHNDAGLDPDNDGLSNYGEYVYGTDPHNPDSDYDGICDGEEVYAAHPTNPMDADDVAHILLGSWRFDDTNWPGLQLQSPILKTNLTLLAGISGNAVSINSTNPAILAYADTNGCIANINLRKGSARFWFKSAWNSGDGDIGNAGSQPRLIELGSKGAADGWFALVLDSKGTNLSFCTPTNATGGYKTNFTVSINWNSNQYHQVVATWSPTNSSLFLDGVLKTNAAGIAAWPNATARAGGFRVGSDSAGANQAKGRFDNLETWNYELSAAEVTAGLGNPCPPAVDVMLVIDRSGSMAELMDGIQKIEVAKRAATNFIRHLRFDPDQAGLVSFWSTSTVNQHLTTDSNAVLLAIHNLDTDHGTRIDYGITNAYSELTNTTRHTPAALAAMVVLTDGNNDDNTSNLVFTAAQTATNAGIRMITVGLGADADTLLLKAIASSTNDFYYAGTTNELDQAYNSIANTLCRLTNLPPSVTITNPVANQTFTYPSSVRIDAVASDPEDGLARVDFYGGTNGTTFIASDYHAPFTTTWTGAQVGTNVLRAVAYDEYGLTSTDSVSVVVISVPPTVQFVSPTNGQLFVFSPTNISITATASVAGASITNLLIYHDATLLGSNNAGLCHVLWTNVPPGTNALSAIAADSLNRRATNNITITNNFVPAVTISTPTNYQQYQQVTNVTITATASDNDGTVTNVTFYSNATSHANGRLPGLSGSNSSVWSLTWTNPPNGTNFVIAVAVDNRGVSNSSTIRLLRMTPTNLAPTVSITYPASNAVFNSGANITIAATATNFPASVTNVQFFANGKLLGSDSSRPYALTECCWKPGTYDLVARASDSFGGSAISMQASITVAGEPPVGEGFWDAEFGLAVSANAPGGGTLYWWNQEYHAGPIGLTDDGKLYAATWVGRMTSNGANWTNLDLPDVGSGYGSEYTALLAEGTNVYVASDNSGYVYRGSGTHFTAISNALNGSVFALAKVGGDIYAAGDFTSAGTAPDEDTNVQYIARFDAVSNRWVAVGNGITNGTVYAIAGLNNELYIGGSFTNAGANANANYIARLAGNIWTNLGQGLAITNIPEFQDTLYPVKALAVCSTNLFVAGEFVAAGGNTNASGIAIWDTVNWRAMDGGPAPKALGSSVLELPHVYTVCVHGDCAYVGGAFAEVLDGTNRAAAYNVARATWSEAEQKWSWSGLDGGVFTSYSGSSHFGVVDQSLVQAGADAGQYDVCFSSSFYGGLDTAGQSLFPSIGIARWRVGYPPPPGPPQVTLTNPVYSAVFSNDPTALVLEGHAGSSTNVVQIDVLANGSWVAGTGLAPASAVDFSLNSSDLNAGAYLLKAVATDENGLKGESKPVLVTIKGTNFFAQDDVFSVVQGSPAKTLGVLSNDGAGLRVSQVAQAQARLGVASRSFDGKFISYTLCSRTGLGRNASPIR